MPYHAMWSYADRTAETGVVTDLRREATSLIERLVRMLAVSLVETERAQAGTGLQQRSAAGKVRIIPKPR